MAQTSNTISLDRLVQLCEAHERVLRWQYPEGALPAEWEDELVRWPADDTEKALERLAALKHFYRLDHERRNPRPTTPDEAEEAARQLIRREPVRVELGDIVAHVTARSYAAMHEMARHDVRIRLLVEDVRRVRTLYAETLGALRRAPRRKRGRLRRRARRLEELHERLHLELYAHRQMLYAHALTPDGAPARGPEDAPDWWVQIDPVWDAALFAAMQEAGPARYARLGAPKEPRRGKKNDGDTLGWASFFASIERQQKIEPAETYDRDLYQLLAWVRAGAPPEPDLDD